MPGMIFFQVWIGSDIPFGRLECIKNAASLMGQEDRFILACDTPSLFSGIDRVETTDCWTMFEKYMGGLPNDRRTFWREMYCRHMNPVPVSEFIRFSAAAQLESLFYLDSDVELFSMPEFNGVKPYFASEPQRMNLFFVNGRTDFFTEILEEWPAVRWGAFAKLFGTIDGRIRTVPPHHYHHHRIRS